MVGNEIQICFPAALYGERKKIFVMCDMEKEEQAGTNDHIGYCNVCDFASPRLLCPRREAGCEQPLILGGDSDPGHKPRPGAELIPARGEAGWN